MNQHSKYTTLDQLLHDYRQDGVDSEGEFTLNPIRARELLEQFQLPEPAHYAVHMVSFLIGAGAKGIYASSSRDQIRYEAAGAEMEFSTLKSPFSVLLQSGAKPHLSELALALNTILGQPESTVEIFFGEWRAVYTQNDIQVEDAPNTELLTIVVHARFGPKGEDRELRFIQEAFRWAVIPIAVNGKRIHQALQSHQDEGLEIHLQNREYPLILGNNVGHRVEKQVKANFSALIRIGRHKPGLRIVFLGRDYSKPLPWKYQVPGWQVEVTINTDCLKKDLSQQDILENDKFKNLLAAVRAQLEWATAYILLQQPPPKTAEPLVDDLLEQMYKSGRTDDVLQYQVKLVQVLGLNNDNWTKGKAMLRLAMIQDARGTADASQKRMALELLEGEQNSDPVEPHWTILKAKMAFAAASHELVKDVNKFLNRSRVPLALREHCYRWLIREGQQDPRLLACYRVDLARQVFETGRPAEALAELDAASRFPEGDFLKESTEYSLKAAQLRGEIAAQAGQMEKALKHIGEYLNGLRDNYGQYSLKLGTPLEQLALILDHLGQKKQAAEYRAWSKRLYEA